MTLRILLALICISTCVFAQNSRTADSLRITGQYRQEYAERLGLGSSPDLKIAEAQVKIMEMDTLGARKILDQVHPTTAEQKFWKQMAESQYHFSLGRFEEALKIQKALSPKPKTLLSAAKDMAISTTSERLQDPLTSIRHLEKAISTFKESGHENHYMHGMALNHLAFAYGEVGFASRTASMANESLKLFMRYHPRAYTTISSTLNNLLFYLIEYGDERQSAQVYASYVTYMENFLQNRSSFPAEEDYKATHAEALYRLSKSRYATMLKDEKRMIQTLRELEDFFKRAPVAWKEKNWGILSAGYELPPYGFRLKKDFAKAMKYAQDIDKAEKRPYNLMKKNAAMALIHYDAQDFPKALPYVEASIAAFPFPPTSKSLQTLMVLKGEVLAKLGRRQEAVATLEQIFKNNMKPNDPVHNFDIKNYPELANSIFLRVLLHSGKSYQHLYELHGKRSEDREKARFFYAQAVQVFEQYYQHGMYNASLGSLLDEIEDGLLSTSKDASEALQDINRIEAISNLHLWRKFSSKYMQNLNLPKSELAQKNNLQLRRNILSRTYELELKNQREINEIDHLLSGIENRLQALSPEYALWSSGNFDLKKIQEQLPAGRVLVKYTIGHKNVYAHKITGGTVALYRLGKKEEVEKLVQSFLGNIKAIQPVSRTLQDALFERILGPLDIENANSILFVAEGFLNFLPYEALFKTPKPISYAFSFKHLLLESKAAHLPAQRLAGFVPTYGTQALPHSLSELQAVQEHWGKSNLYIGQEATKSNFLQSLGQYRTHHLAMHSVLDEEDYEESHLLFSNEEKMYFHELYALNFPSDLVVLSACNTGLGQYLNGEGVMSLARALSYAGVKSSVASLWQIPDKESAELMRLFYQNLEKGLSKDQALMEAKLSFVEENPMKSHPYYWAGFILSGDVQPLSFGSNRWYWLGLLPLLILLGLRYKKNLAKPVAKR